MKEKKSAPHIEIKTNGAMETEIKIDGQKVSGVREMKLFQKGNGIPTLSLEFLATDVSFDGIAVPELPEVLRDWYVRKQEEE